MHGRCEICGGTGYLKFTEPIEEREYCACLLGVELRRMDLRIENKKRLIRREIEEFAKKNAAHLSFGADFKKRASGDGQ